MTDYIICKNRESETITNNSPEHKHPVDETTTVADILRERGGSKLIFASKTLKNDELIFNYKNYFKWFIMFIEK